MLYVDLAFSSQCVNSWNRVIGSVFTLAHASLTLSKELKNVLPAVAANCQTKRLGSIVRSAHPTAPAVDASSKLSILSGVQQRAVRAE